MKAFKKCMSRWTDFRYRTEETYVMGIIDGKVAPVSKSVSVSDRFEGVSNWMEFVRNWVFPAICIVSAAAGILCGIGFALSRFMM